MSGMQVWLLHAAPLLTLWLWHSGMKLSPIFYLSGASVMALVSYSGIVLLSPVCIHNWTNKGQKLTSRFTKSSPLPKCQLFNTAQEWSSLTSCDHVNYFVRWMYFHSGNLRGTESFKTCSLRIALSTTCHIYRYIIFLCTVDRIIEQIINVWSCYWVFTCIKCRLRH